VAAADMVVAQTLVDQVRAGEALAQVAQTLQDKDFLEVLGLQITLIIGLAVAVVAQEKPEQLPLRQRQVQVDAELQLHGSLQMHQITLGWV
jgi:hypothetical protein